MSSFRQRKVCGKVLPCTDGTFALALPLTTVNIFHAPGLLSIMCAMQGLRSVTRALRYS